MYRGFAWSTRGSGELILLCRLTKAATAMALAAALAQALPFTITVATLNDSFRSLIHS